MKIFRTVLSRLRNPKTLLSLVAQVAAVLILLGVKIDENMVMTVTVGIISILATLGLLTHPDKENEPWDAILPCSNTGEPEPHVLIINQMRCKRCGAVRPPEQTGSFSEAACGEKR